jgi:hypothetical protein
LGYEGVAAPRALQDSSTHLRDAGGSAFWTRKEMAFIIHHRHQAGYLHLFETNSIMDQMPAFKRNQQKLKVSENDEIYDGEDPNKRQKKPGPLKTN